MARRRKQQRVKGENKSAAIRDYSKEHPDAGPKAIADALNATHGWTISAAYVSTIKSKAGAASRSKRPSVTGSGINEVALIEAKRFADQVGLEQARAAIELLQRLSS